MLNRYSNISVLLVNKLPVLSGSHFWDTLSRVILIRFTWSMRRLVDLIRNDFKISRLNRLGIRPISEKHLLLRLDFPMTRLVQIALIYFTHLVDITCHIIFLLSAITFVVKIDTKSLSGVEVTFRLTHSFCLLLELTPNYIKVCIFSILYLINSLISIKIKISRHSLVNRSSILFAGRYSSLSVIV